MLAAEQHADITCYVLLCSSPSETSQMLEGAYGKVAINASFWET
jgi:hypothetical protein